MAKRSKRLTDIGIKKMRPGPGRREIPDAGSGLYHIIHPTDRRTYAFRYRLHGQPKKLTFPAGLSLAGARRLAADAAYQVAQGIDPAAEKKRARIAAMEADASTVAAVCANFLKRKGAKLRSAARIENTCQRLIYPHLGQMPVASVKRKHINAMLDHIEDHNGPRMADVTLGTLRSIFSWYAVQDDDFASPVVRGMERQKAVEHQRSRILDDEELRKVWEATADDTSFSALVRFLLLTTARRGEAAAMKFEEVGEDGIWELPVARSKTKTPVFRPLSKAAKAVLDSLPRVGEYAFTFNARPFTNFSKAKAALDQKSGVSGYTLHDLRRTGRSLMSRAGVLSDHAERVLGHSIRGSRGVYDRHDYVNEKRHALEALAAQIERIVAPPADIPDIAEARAARRRV